MGIGIRREKLNAIVVIFFSVVILVTIMYVGKTIGRVVSEQQASLKEKFPESTDSANGRLEVSAQEESELFSQFLRLVIMVVVATTAVTIIFIIAQRSVVTEIEIK